MAITNQFGSNLLNPVTSATQIPTTTPSVSPLAAAMSSNPVASPGAAPASGSLSGTLTNPTPPSTQPVYTPTSGQTTSAAVQAQGAGGIGQTPQLPGQVSTSSANPTALAQAMTAIQGQVANNNSLLQQKNLVLQQLYDQPLSDAQKAQLDPGLASVLASGDRNAIDFNLKLLNDQIAGRTNTLTQNVQYLTQGYNTAVQQAETQKNDAIQNVLNYAKANGQAPSVILNALYPSLAASLGPTLDSITAPYSTTTQNIYASDAGANGITSLDGLLGYYAHGDASNATGPGYSGAVMEALNGTGLTLQSPVADLLPYTGQIAQGIINGENISPELLAATNNPGAIEQATALAYGLPTTPQGYYDSNNGITYAQFADQGTGQQVLQSLVGDYLQKAQASTISATPPSGPTANVINPQTGVTPNGLYAAALQYATTGEMPSIGLGNSLQQKTLRQQIISMGGAITAASGTSLAQNKAQLTNLTSQLTTQSTHANNMQRSVSTVEANIPILQEAAGYVNASDAPIANQLTNAITLSTGNGALNAFNTALQTVRTEYATLLGRGTPTDQTRSEATNLIPDNITLSQLNSVITILKQEGNNVVSSANQQVKNVQDQLTQLTQPTGAGASGAGASGAGASGAGASGAGSSDYQNYLSVINGAQ